MAARNNQNGGRGQQNQPPARRPNAMPQGVPQGESPSGRYIRATQDASFADPIRRYYINRGINPVEDYAWRGGSIVSLNKLLFGSFSFEDVDQNRPLSVDNPNSVIVNWSYEGYLLQNQRDTVLRGYGVNTNPIPWWQAATTLERNTTGDNGISPFNPQETSPNQSKWLIFSSSLPAPLGQNSDFNMAQTMTSLAAAAQIKRIENQTEEQQVLSQISMATHAVSGQLAVAGLTRAAVQNEAQYWSPFGDNNGAVRPPRNAWELQQIIQQRFSTEVARKAALAAYPIEIYMRQASGSYVDYNFFDFQVASPMVEDRGSYLSLKRYNYGNADPDAPSLAFINPEYNFYNRKYEEAASNPNLPETILPNMYIYELGNRYGEFPIDGAPSWQGSELQQQEVVGGYDKMLTLDEFDKGVLPNLESEEFQQYLETYADAVKNKPISVDLFGEINRKNSNTITPAGDMDIYPQFYDKRHAFPMYIELGVPTAPLGTFGKLIEKTATSSGFMSSLTVATPSSMQFTMETAGFKSPGERQFPVLTSELGIRVQNTKVYDFSDWFDAVAAGTIFNVLSKKGMDFPPGINEADCLDYMTQLQLTSIRRGIEAASLQRMVTYSDVLRGKKICESETTIYKVSKFRVVSNGPDELVQTYYFPNNSFTDVINFVDTQVKYDTLYRYDLTGIAVVYGSKFRFRTRNWNAPTTPVPGDNVYFSFNVETLPDLKVVEYPIFSNMWNQAIGADGSGGWVYGVNYPAVKVMDRPPVPPEIDVIPYKTDPTSVLINLNASTGEFLGPRSQPYISFSAEEQAENEELNTQQKTQEYYQLHPGFLEYKSEGAEEIVRMEIYRTIDLDSGAQTPQQLYESFGADPHKILSLEDFVGSDGEGVDTSATAFDCIDILLPNTKYYYTARSIDRHGKVSNPTPIYEVELVFDSGRYFPQVAIYEPPSQMKETVNKSMVRYLEIKAADIQAQPFYESTDDPRDAQDSSWTIGLVTDSEDQVQNNSFVVRITSRDTGRKVDLRLDFKKDIKRQ